MVLLFSSTSIICPFQKPQRCQHSFVCRSALFLCDDGLKISPPFSRVIIDNKQIQAIYDIEQVQEEVSKLHAQHHRDNSIDATRRSTSIGLLFDEANVIAKMTQSHGDALEFNEHPRQRQVSDESNRSLQDTECPTESGITVSSSLFPLLEGCLSATNTSVGGEEMYASNTGTILAVLGTGQSDVSMHCNALLFVCFTDSLTCVLQRW